MVTSSTGWWHRHGWTVALLLTAFGISFALRTIWAYPVVAQWGPLFTYAGGSDSYYHSRVTTYIIQNHRNLILDPLLRFPVGAVNPREPLFDWMNAILGIVFAPFFGGNAVVAGAWFLDLQAPLWAALGIFPLYLIGREVSGRAGLLAALIYPFLSANIDSTIFGYANYLSFYTFIILVVVYSYIRTVKAVGNRRWVDSYRNPRAYLPGLRGFLRTERTAVKWAVFTGVSLGALALAWQGYTYGVVVIGVSVFIAMIAERIRRVDSFGLYVATWIVGLVGFPMAMPYYLFQHQFTVWFDLPLLLFFGVLLLLLPFLLLRDVPWVFSIPVLGLLVVAAAALLAVVIPSYFTSIVTGQGYFVKTLIYSTVAEAQAPSIDSLVIGYGIVTFFLAFVGLAIFVYLLVHDRFKRYHVVFLVFAVLSIYLPVSAAKFFLLGSPIFALLPAEALRRALDITGYPELRRTVASLSDRRSQLGAFRRAFKARHVLVMALVVGLILPNVWVAINAGIPGNTKGQYASQVASTLPPWLQVNHTSSSSYYFGAAGSSLDTPNQYDSASYNWLAQQDTNLPPAQRPAFLSWWDYGFQAIAQGDHPSVADNFQNGIDPSGQFLLSQNESQGIGVLITTLLQAELKKTGSTYLPGSLDQVLANDGVNVAHLNSYLSNTSADYALVLAHPERYLQVDPSTITHDNAMYLAVEYFLATSLPLAGVAKVYNDVQAYTGWSIRYVMADTRLFPFSGTDTGIFYAPADLTGRVISPAGIPTTFFNVFVNGSDGNTYPLGQVPAGVTPVSYSVAYYAPFYNSMIYHIYIGYNGTDIGDGAGIPGLAGSQTVVNSPLMPGWMLQHFEIDYKTAYYCPQANATSSSSCYTAMNEPTAKSLAAKTGGTADSSAGSYFGGGESMLEYYPGQTFLGDVILPDGTPVGGARVTVDDGWGIPHMTTRTAADGSFSVVLPPGNDTVNITAGPVNGLLQQGSTLLKSVKVPVPDVLGFSYNAPTLVQTITVAASTVQGFVYWNANNTTFVPHVDPLIPGAKVLFWGENGTAPVSATTDASGSFAIANVPPGVYHFNVLYAGRNYSEGSVTLTPKEVYNATIGLLPGVFSGTVTDATGALVFGATVTLGNASGSVASTTTNASGQYAFRTVGAGNYTLTASGPSPDLRSGGVFVSAANPGENVSTDLTVRPVSTVTLTVVSNGAPAANIPVRFVPIASYENASSPIAPLVNASESGTVVATGSNGVAVAALAPGSYSVYAVGYVGTSISAGLGDFTVPAAGLSLSDSLTLSNAVRLAGSFALSGATSNATRRAVIAYAPSGGEAVTWADSNGTYSFLLPTGSYTLLAFSGTVAGTSGTAAELTSVDLTGPTTLPLAPGSAIASQFTVGTTLPSGSIFPADGAAVSVSAGAGGPAVPAVASAGGVVTFYVPSALGSSGPTYCVSAQSLGFVPATECGISPNGLSTLTQFPLTLKSVSVSLTVVGLPSGASVVVNLTAESPSAASRTLSGGPTFSFSAPPGIYGVGAWASLSNGTLYLPPSILSTTLPLGATYSNLTLYLLPLVVAKGSVNLPPGVPLSHVNVTLFSPVQNLTVNGTVFTSGFRATPGTYSAYANATSGGVAYVNLTRLTIAGSGAIGPALSLVASGVRVVGTLTNSTGAATALNTTLTLTNPAGALRTVTVRSGSFSVELPPNVRYDLEASASSVTPGQNGSFYESWTSLPGASCTPTVAAPACDLEMIPTTQLVGLNGTLTSPGFSGPIAGTVWLVGPYPSDNVTLVPAPDGTFALQVLPGAYSVYASASGLGSLRAAFGSVLALPSAPGLLSLSLTPTWTATIALAPPNGSAAGLGPVTITLRDAYGHRLVYAGLAGSSIVTVALPAGTYSVSAVATGSFHGVATNASARTTFTVANGNLGVPMALTYVPVYRVSSSLVGPTSATVTAGGTVTFAFRLQDSGNVPVTVTPVGTPAYWTFNFSFSSVTLVPGGPNVSGEVRILVPAGTPVNHPGATLEFELSNGTVVGRATPAPTVQVVGYYGVGVGPASVPVEVGPNQAIAPFYVVNRGNTYEDVTLSIVDLPRLESLGWAPSIHLENQRTTSVASFPPNNNETFFVFLNATSSVFVPPGSVTVSVSVVNASGSLQVSAVLPISIGSVQPKTPPGSTPVTVTGPSIGSPTYTPSAWLVAVLAFVPAIALAVGLTAYRWWKTRRWNRK